MLHSERVDIDPKPAGLSENDVVAWTVDGAFMEYLFITPTGTLQECWHAAFPDAVAVSSTAEAAVLQYGVLWLDANSCQGTQGKRQLREAVALGQPVVVLTDTLDAKEAVRVMGAGAAGYCHASTAPRQFWEIALVVEHGGVWIAPELKREVFALSAAGPALRTLVKTDVSSLTSREQMVAEQVARGATNREIAATLMITERTVKAHLSAIFEKLSVRDRVQLALRMNNLPVGLRVR
jgi:DNA-binding NarL/FixJ family response regulator